MPESGFADLCSPQEIGQRTFADRQGPKPGGGDAAGTVALARGGRYWLEIKDDRDTAGAIDPFRVLRPHCPARRHRSPARAPRT